eukprot:gene28190-34900_t
MGGAMQMVMNGLGLVVHHFDPMCSAHVYGARPYNDVSKQRLPKHEVNVYGDGLMEPSVTVRLRQLRITFTNFAHWLETSSKLAKEIVLEVSEKAQQSDGLATTAAPVPGMEKTREEDAVEVDLEVGAEEVNGEVAAVVKGGWESAPMKDQTMHDGARKQLGKAKEGGGEQAGALEATLGERHLRGANDAPAEGRLEGGATEEERKNFSNTGSSENELDGISEEEDADGDREEHEQPVPLAIRRAPRVVKPPRPPDEVMLCRNTPSDAICNRRSSQL